VAILLEGFIDYHKIICIRSECPSKKRYQKTKKYQKIFNKETDTETIILLIHLIDTIY